jgi:hypothetical protein
MTLDRRTLTERVSRLPQNKMALVLPGIDIVLDK